MRVRSILTASAALTAVFAASSAMAATQSEIKISLDLSSMFTPTQYDADGNVYGVKARSAGTAANGSGTIQPIGALGRKSQSVTPGACSSGWCDTPEHIASSVFGWDFSYDGSGAVIGIVDTGIDLNHPDFAGRILSGHCVVSSVNSCSTVNDQLGGDAAIFPGPNATHGTHVAGIAAGTETGLATGADILPVKVCSSSASSCSGVDAGIVWASENGADVINVSIGGPILSASDVDAFRTAIGNGSLLVVAAGNGGTRNPTGGFLAGAAMQDGVRGSMIVVGSTSSGGTYGTVSSFSQVPSTRCEIHGGKRYCMRDFFVSAPGSNIWSTVGNGTSDTSASYGYLSGTSMATPYVTGVAAVIKGRWPELTSSQIADIIFSTADDIGAPGVDPVFGRGAVDITKAMSPVGPTLVPNNVSNLNSFNGFSASNTNLKGSFGATSSLVSGPLSVAVRNSSVLQNVVAIDSYGRDFKANLSNTVYNPGLNLDYLVSNAFNTSYSPFAFAGTSPIGNFVASGYAVDTTTPSLISGEFRTTDHHKYDVQDLHIMTALMPGVTLEAGYNARMAGNFNAYDTVSSQAYDGLFLSASGVNSPYVSLADGGNYVGTSIDLADDLHVRFAQASVTPQKAEYEVPVFAYLTQTMGPNTQYDRRNASSSMMAVNWDFASWGGLGLTASQTNEQNGLLGGMASGALDLANSANTSAIGMSGRVGFGDGWVTTVSYSEGITNLNLKADSIFTSADTLRSRSYGIAIAKHGLFGKSDSLGLAVSRPVQIYDGSVGIAAATSIDADRNLVIGRERVSLASATPETDLELGYVTTFFDGAVALQANAGYQMNVAGEQGRNGVTVLSRAKFNF